MINIYNKKLNNRIIKLDAAADVESVGSALEKLFNIASKKGRAIGFLRIYPSTLSALKNIRYLEEKFNVKLVPISNLYDK